jgi:hypothetical protein
VPDYRYITGRWRQTPEPTIDHELRSAARRYIEDHPGYVARVAFWNTARMLDVAGLGWSRHTAATISIGPRWADAGVVCFWAFAALAIAGALTRRARQMPGYVVAIPVLLFLSVVFLAVETPRYRTGIDPFIVMLAGTALVAGWDALASRNRRHERLSATTAPPRS